ncbi:MAG: hypothetical protein L0323_09145 [Planctomycetes bacterium]|nr:hypothetical protein [Planctomycetota bacterium]
MTHSRLRPFLVLSLLAAPVAAQPNVVPGLDLALEATIGINDYVRSGVFPNGASAWGAGTTCCNPGTVGVPFQAAMDPDHGFIHLIVARESGGRLVQISDWSYVKHTFGSSNDPSSCGSCFGGPFAEVAVGCNDTYSNGQFVDHYLLGPPGEVNPWTGIWNPVCSHFDKGEPLAPLAQQCDGVRSLTTSQASALNAGLNHQMRVHDVDLTVAGATYWWQAGYLVPGEAEANRGNNIGSRGFSATWNGSSYSVTSLGTLLSGSVLQRWTGASVSSNTNGTDDGRLFVAVKVTGPTNGLYHYEYAVHNRDNNRGTGAFRIPICPGAQVSNLGFHDVDQDAGNPWAASVVGSEIVYSTAGNPLRWNSIFNFWFDCDAAPVGSAALDLDAFDPGPGAASVAVTSTAPLGLYNVNLGPGCGNQAAPSLYATGTPARATLGNASFGLQSGGNASGGAVFLVASAFDGTQAVGPGCTLHMAGGFGTGLLVLPPVTANASGLASFPLPVPNQPAIEGAHLNFQAVEIQAGGALLGQFDLSSGLRVRIGNAVSDCP